MASRRRRRTEAERQALLAELDASGLSVAQFAREHGLSAWTIYDWRRRARSREGSRQGATFVEVEVAGWRGASQPFEVELRCGARVRVPDGFDAEELRRLLEVVASC